MRDDLFRSHPQTPASPPRADFEAGVPYFDYDPALRVLGVVEPAERDTREIATSGEHPYSFTRFAPCASRSPTSTRSTCTGSRATAAGVFLSFADATSGTETYGAGRYLLDTVKGADLGEQNGRLVLDFNFAYNPSCSYDPRWVCPLAPPGNRLAAPIRAGERYPLEAS